MKIYSKSGKSLLLFWLISISCSIGLFAQVNSNKKIKTISFKGIEKNREHYLKQFIQSEVGKLSADSLLHSDIQRLKNIASISNVTYEIDTTDYNFHLIFQIEEVNTLLPIVNFGGTKGNIWYQLGFNDINWQGNGSFLSAVYQNNDGRHGGQIYYRATRMRASDWGFQ